jgi:diguanylate cyclase (GGDEF)-like protein
MSDPTENRGAHPRDQRRHSISAKIIFLVFLCTFGTALAISWITLQATHGALRQRIEGGFPAALERSEAEIVAWLDDGRGQLERLSRRSTDGQRLRRLATEGSPGALETGLVRAALERFLNDSPHFDGAALLSPDAKWQMRVGSFDAQDHSLPTLPLALSLAAATRLNVDPTGPAGLAVVPLVRDDPKGGFLAARYDSSRIEKILRDELHDLPGTIALADAEGRILASVGADGFPGAVAAHSLAQLLENPRPGVLEYADHEGAHAIGAVRVMDDTGSDWSVVIETPFATAFAPVRDVVTRIFVTDLFIILIFIGFAHRITAGMLRPIEELSEGARLASQGELTKAMVDPRTHDEIGRLTRAFNDMMTKLRSSQDEAAEANRQLVSQNEELQRANEVLSQLSITDGLTKLHNHRYFQERLTREIKRQSRTHKPLSMLLVDLDDFKALNDRLGHASGDELLMRVAAIMDETVRESDLLARYGGEEFVVLATDTNLEGAVQLAEKIRMAVEQEVHIVNDSLRPVRITVSVGVAQYSDNRRLFFESADRGLYRAKEQGKNCVVAADEGVPLE